MKKSTKGALAAAAAGALLLGGAGSLAYWTDTQVVTGGDVNGGTLSLGTLSCGWTVSHMGGADAAFDPGADHLVPGDTATETCTSTISAVGANLAADLAATGGALSGDLSTKLTRTVGFTVGGSSVSGITSADDGKELKATIVLDFPIGATADNTSNGGKSVTVSDYTITATQVH